MKYVIWAAIVAALLALTGCDITEDYTGEADYLQDGYAASTGGWRTYCTNRTVLPSLVVEVDSTVSCPFSDSGTYAPYLIRAEWVSTNPQCSFVKPGSVVGGLKGISRKFGCSKEAPSNPVYRLNHQPCADCDWPK